MLAQDNSGFQYVKVNIIKSKADHLLTKKGHITFLPHACMQWLS